MRDHGRRRGSEWAVMKMELTGVNWVVVAAGFLLIWASGGSAAPLECHFDSRGEKLSHHTATVLKKKERETCLKLGFTVCVCVPSKLCVSSKGSTTPWGRPGWTTLACSAPVCTPLALVAVRRE